MDRYNVLLQIYKIEPNPHHEKNKRIKPSEVIKRKRTLWYSRTCFSITFINRETLKHQDQEMGKLQINRF